MAGSIRASRGAQLRGRGLIRAGLGRALACCAALLGLAPALAQADDAGLVWALRGAHNTVYLAGSVHLLRDDGAPLPAPLERAYGDAEALLMEIDLDSLDPMAGARFTATHAIYGADTSLPAVLGEQRWRATVAAAERAGVPPAMLERFEPWAVALLLTVAQLQKEGLSPEAGVEQQLARRAAQDGKPIDGLETLEQQLTLFDALSPELQARFLELTVAEAADVGTELDQIYAAWRAGRVEDLEALLTREYARFPELYASLVDARNAAWVAPIRAQLERREDVLVVVGSLHLVGPQSVIARLRAAGLEPVRVTAR